MLRRATFMVPKVGFVFSPAAECFDFLPLERFTISAVGDDISRRS